MLVQGPDPSGLGTLTDHPYSSLVASGINENSLRYSDEYSSRKVLVSGSPNCVPKIKHCVG